MGCKQCLKKVSDQDRIACRGYCGAIFHMICAKVDVPLREQLDLNQTQVFWMCGECAKLFSNSHFRRVVKDHDGGNSEIAESMKTMQNDIANLTSTITDLKEKVQTQSTSLSTPTWPNKRQRGSSTDTPVKVAIPTASRGTKAMNSVPVIAAEPNDLWYLWLSSFPPSVTDEDIHSMVKECLSVEDDDPIVVKMLVKKGVDVSTLSSVTFKVGIGRDYRESSMDAANWPEGLSFREFVDIDRRPAPTVLPSGFSRRRLE